jgi:hypothetical protein
MKPKFKNTLAWEQAQLLMQPVFIRVIDNLRKQLDESLWTGIYQETDNPYPGYELYLTYQDRSFTVNLWDLCFQVCFLEYYPAYRQKSEEEISVTQDQDVEIDPSLIDEMGEVDWQRLETKSQRLIKEFFANLPRS